MRLSVKLSTRQRRGWLAAGEIGDVTAEIALVKAWDWHFLVPVVVICFEHLLITFGIHETGDQKRRAFISMQIRESRSLTRC
jgi:hypothetical protein